MKDRFKQIAKEIGEITAEKNEAYGDAATGVAEIMLILYPDGVLSGDYGDQLLLVRILDKVCRIARGDKGSFGESPYRDIAGYAILGVEKDERNGS